MCVVTSLFPSVCVYVCLTVLVDEHAEGDAVCVEAIQEVLDAAADEGVKSKLVLVLHHALRHGGNHVVVTVTDLNQQLQEAGNAARVDQVTSVLSAVLPHFANSKDQTRVH